jgi:phosphoribosylformylglycinamidine (FGAM) synthase-like enzyme
LLLDLIQRGLIESAHDVSEGGIITAIAESCISNEKNQIGAKVDIPVKNREDFSFFSESQSRVVISIDAGKKEEFERIASESFVPFYLLGETGGKNLEVNRNYIFEVSELSDIYFNTISERMNAKV